MKQPSIGERPPSDERQHPPFRMREHRRRLLPDLTLPTLEELRWAAQQRRLRRDAPIPEPRRARHEPLDAGEDAAVTATVQQPDVIELPDLVAERTVIEEPDVIEETDVAEPVAVTESVVAPEPPAWRPAAVPELRAWRPAAEPEPEREREREPEADDEPPPLVSQILVVREPVPVEPSPIAVLDEPRAEVATVTRLVPLPVEPAIEASPDEAVYEDLDHVEPEVPSEVEGRPAPLYWRLLRLRYTRPNGWLRALFFEGAVAIAAVLVLAEAASVWTIVVLPFVVAVVVKANDVLAGSLQRNYRSRGR